MTQNFKGDAQELLFEQAGSAAFDLCSQAKDEFFGVCYDTDNFLLMLYDAGRMPFTDRVPRDSFVGFLRSALANFPVTGTFESYIFILKSLFGDGTTVQFTVVNPGHLSILVNATDLVEHQWQSREFVDGEYVYSDIATFDGDDLIQFKGISGIDSQAKLQAIISELIPVGIYTEISLDFYELLNFITSAGDDIVDYLGNQIVFFET